MVLRGVFAFGAPSMGAVFVGGSPAEGRSSRSKRTATAQGRPSVGRKRGATLRGDEQKPSSSWAAQPMRAAQAMGAVPSGSHQRRRIVLFLRLVRADEIEPFAIAARAARVIRADWVPPSGDAHRGSDTSQRRSVRRRPPHVVSRSHRKWGKPRAGVEGLAPVVKRDAPRSAAVHSFSFA
jgi:hypothetical protein